MNSPRALVVLATYNGAHYLSAQLESLQAQSMGDWRLLVSDDGSCDNTVQLLVGYAKRDRRITLLPPREGGGGHVANFEYLLEQARSYAPESLFLCDQDDIWRPDKLELQLESLAGKSAVFSDVEVFSNTDCRGVSYLQDMGLAPPGDLYQLIAQNSVVGCSMAIHPNLLELALPFPVGLQNHDWWLALCAMCSGGLGFDEAMLTRYRQHGGNTIGSKNWYRQLPRIRHLLERQQKNMLGKQLALEELSARLQAKEQEVPGAIRDYLHLFQGVGRWRSAWRLASGPFRPPSLALRALQSAALLRG